MAKAKKGKKASADAVYAKKSEKANPFSTAQPATSKKWNPFEVHTNREKFQILGRTCKHDKGLPGVSRAKAVKKRKATLGQEFKERHKTNRFQDRRIGKHLSGEQLTEDVLNARFLADRMAQVKQSKADRFNLNEDEVLTHRGQTLEEIEQFRDERSDDEDVDDAALDADFTEAAHFGGDASDENAKDRQAAIDDMILEQKRRKVEIAKEKDEVHNLTAKLDSNYKTLMGLVGKATKNEMKTKPPPDDYDKILREMVFEPRGKVADKLLSEEETAKREKERLEQLEKERLRRMQPDGEGAEQQEQSKHRSADDLDDGYFAYGAEEEEDGTLAYNLDGKLGTKFDNNSKANGEHDEEEGSIEADADADADEESGDTEESDGDEASDDDDDEDDESEGDDDNMSDLKYSDSEEEEEGDDKAVEAKKNVLKVKKDTSLTNGHSDEIPKSKPTDADSRRNERVDLPFTIDMPMGYKDFRALVANHTPEDQATIVERIIKCNHPKLDGVNREKIIKLFAFLLQYVNELFADPTPDDIALHCKILDRLTPHLFDLIQLNPERMSRTLLNVLKEKYAEYRKQPKNFPTLETVMYFKLVSNCYSTSDFRHQVVTPCFIFMQHILSQARVRTRQDVATGLLLVTVSLEYAQQSQRFLPAALNFVLGIIFLSIPKRSVEVHKIVPPFQASGPQSKLLAIAESVESTTLMEQLLTSEDLVLTTFSTDFKIRALNTTLRLVKDVIDSVSERVGSNYLAEPLLSMLERLPLDVYPEFLRRNHEAAKTVLNRVATKPLKRIVPPAKKPKALRLLEPRIETIYDDKRRPKLTKEKEEKVKLLHKFKRETKGAIREIRRDTEFLQKMRIQQQIQGDLERKEKVKRIYQEASVQQGELNELARLKKRKKF